MEVTEVRVNPVHEGNLKATVAVVLDHQMVIEGLKLYQIDGRLVIGMPEGKGLDGSSRSVVRCLDDALQEQLKRRILADYESKNGFHAREGDAEFMEVETTHEVHDSWFAILGRLRR